MTTLMYEEDRKYHAILSQKPCMGQSDTVELTEERQILWKKAQLRGITQKVKGLSGNIQKNMTSLHIHALLHHSYVFWLLLMHFVEQFFSKFLDPRLAPMLGATKFIIRNALPL